MSRQAISIRNERRLDLRLAVRADDVLPRAGRAGRASLRRWTSACRTTTGSPADHGQGAETIMRAEAAVLPGTLHRRAYRTGARLCPDRGQRAGEYGALLRFSGVAAFSLRGGGAGADPSRSAVRRCCGSTTPRGSTSGTPPAAYYHALRGEPEKIPELFAQHRLSAVNILAPGKPDDGDDRKSGVSDAGRLCQGHRPERRTAGGLRGAALRAGRAACPHPDCGGL